MKEGEIEAARNAKERYKTDERVSAAGDEKAEWWLVQDHVGVHLCIVSYLGSLKASRGSMSGQG